MRLTPTCVFLSNTSKTFKADVISQHCLKVFFAFTWVGAQMVLFFFSALPVNHSQSVGDVFFAFRWWSSPNLLSCCPQSAAQMLTAGMCVSFIIAITPAVAMNGHLWLAAAPLAQSLVWTSKASTIFSCFSPAQRKTARWKRSLILCGMFTVRL